MNRYGIPVKFIGALLVYLIVAGVIVGL